MFVYVLNHLGEPLMPCNPRKARLLIKEDNARVVKRTPFTIQLNYGSSGYKQDVSLGIDAGTKHIGVSATVEKTVLYEGEVRLRTDIPDLMTSRNNLRHVRRSRKTRYRKPRFLNRTRPKGWLPPSVRDKVNSHIKVVRMLHEILPIKHLTVEVAQFDTQLLKNPDVEGIAYQQGEQMGFWNTREYVLFRDHHTCQRCRGKSKDPILNVHHMESRKTGGNSPSNLVTLCETCHHEIHKHHLEHTMVRKMPPFRDAGTMTVMRWFIYGGIQEHYPHIKLTYGYLTKSIRIQSGLDKSHRTDARCISGNPLAKAPMVAYFYKRVRKNNRQLHKMTISKGGYRKANKAERFVHGFQLFDKVRYEGKECFIFGRRSSGYFDLRKLDGKPVHRSVSYKKLRMTEKANTLIVEMRQERK